MFFFWFWLVHGTNTQVNVYMIYDIGREIKQ